MRILTPGEPAVKAGPSKVRAEDSVRAAWRVRTSIAFLDARGNPIGHRLGWMLLILEGYCRSRAWCWVGNRELAAAYGCSESTAGTLLRELEAAGLIRRILSEGDRPGRIGIVLMRRADPDLPIATAETLGEVERAMRADATGRRKSAGSAPEKPAPSSHRKSGTEERRSRSKQDAQKDDRPSPAAAESSGMLTLPTPPAPPRPRTEPSADPGGTNVRSSPTSNGNAPEGNRVAGRGPLHPETRELVDRWLSLGGALADQARRFLAGGGAGHRRGASARGAAMDSLPNCGVSTIALLEQLGPACDRGAIAQCVHRLCREFGDGHSQGFYQATFNDVRMGAMPSSVVVEAYRRATAPGVRNRGAMFAATVRARGS